MLEESFQLLKIEFINYAEKGVGYGRSLCSLPFAFFKNLS